MITLRAEHINPFIQATIDTWKAMIRVKAVPMRPVLMKKTDYHIDISGVIGLSGGAQGTVALGFPRIAALKTISAFVGEKVLALDGTATDAVGELANIVAGAAKQGLSDYRILISLPQVVLGDKHELVGARGVVPIAVPFQCELGDFILAVGFKSEIDERKA